MDAVYRQRVESVDQISTLPQQFREQLAQRGISVGFPKVEKKFVSVDGTVRYLIAFADGQSVETVWMPERRRRRSGGDGTEAGRVAPKLAPLAAGLTGREPRYASPAR